MEPEEIIYQRWWSVYPAGLEGGEEDFPDEEGAVRRAIEFLKVGAIYVSVTRNDRPKT